MVRELALAPRRARRELAAARCRPAVLVPGGSEASASTTLRTCVLDPLGGDRAVRTPGPIDPTRRAERGVRGEGVDSQFARLMVSALRQSPATRCASAARAVDGSPLRLNLGRDPGTDGLTRIVQGDTLAPEHGVDGRMDPLDLLPPLDSSASSCWFYDCSVGLSGGVLRRALGMSTTPAPIEPRRCLHLRAGTASAASSHVHCQV